MKPFLSILFLLSPWFLSSQGMIDLDPSEIRPLQVELDSTFFVRFNSEDNRQICKEIWKRMDENQSLELTEEVRQSFLYCDPFRETPWNKPFEGCSWHCGGRIDSIRSTNPEHDTFFMDGDYATYWLSGTDNAVSSFAVHFHRESARVTEILFVNGAVRSDELFNQYSRAKTIQLYYNDKPLALLQLKDIKDIQVFSFSPLGNARIKKSRVSKRAKDWKLTFKILEVYPGKSTEVAISDIDFEGEHE